MTVSHDELFLVVGKSHPFYNHPSITMEMLDNQSLISREDESMDRNQFDEFLRDNNIYMVKKWRCTNVQAIINSVAAGRGIGILSNMLIEKEVANGDLRILEVEGIHIKRPIKLIYHKSKYLTETINQFIEASKEH